MPLKAGDSVISRPKMQAAAPVPSKKTNLTESWAFGGNFDEKLSRKPLTNLCQSIIIR